MSSQRRWKFFCQDWRLILQEFGIAQFHAKDFFKRKDGYGYQQYESWSDDKASQFIFGLTETINDNGLHPLGCAINIPDFNKFSIGERRFLTGGIWDSAKGAFTSHGKPSAPYFAAFQYFVREALNRTPSNARLHLVFDRQYAMEPKARETFENMISLPNLMPGSEKLASIEYNISHDTPQLQASDLYAHGWYNFLTNGLSNDKIMRITMTRLTMQSRDMGLFNAQGIENNLQKHLPTTERKHIQEQN